jgi:V-type H+-transporting ATPase proteolipid subunit
MNTSELCPAFAPFFGFSGAAFSMIMSSLGAAYGTAKAGIGIAGMGVFRPDLYVLFINCSIMKCLIPVVMAGIICVYGLVVSVLIVGNIDTTAYSLYSGFIHMGAGLAVGLSGLGGGYAIGVVGDACVRGVMYQPRLFVGMVLILIFAEVLGLYGLIVSLILNTKTSNICS